MNRPAWRWHHPRHLLAGGFGAGAIPFAPGTFGTVVGVLFYLPMSRLPLPLYLVMVAGVVALGVYLCGATARDLGVHDHPGIVWDEIAGYLVTMIAAPRGWVWPVAGFVLFRIFDILKPWPVRVADRRVGGGVGIMLDDILAGIYAASCLQLAAWLTGAYTR